MGGPSNGGGGGRTDAGPNRTTAQRYTKPTTTKPGTKSNPGNYQTINESGKVVGSSFISEGANKSNRDIDKMPLSGTKLIATFLKEPLAKGAKYNRKAFANLVVGNTKKGGIKISKEDWNSMSNDKKEEVFSKQQKARMAGQTDFYGRDISRDGRTGKNKKSIEQPKVASQMDNSGVKSDLITATGPTDIEMANTTEMSEGEKLIARKRGKKTKTILSSVTGDNTKATLSRKTLLG